MATTNPKVERGIKACRGKWGNMRWWVIWASVISFYRSIQYKICRSEKRLKLGDFRRQFSTFVLQGSFDLNF